MYTGAAIGGLILGLGDAYNILLALHAAVVFRGEDLERALRRHMRGLIARGLVVLLAQVLPARIPSQPVLPVFASAALTYTIAFALALGAVLVLYRSLRAPWAQVWMPRITRQASSVYLEDYRAWQERLAAEPDADR